MIDIFAIKPTKSWHGSIGVWWFVHSWKTFLWCLCCEVTLLTMYHRDSSSITGDIWRERYHPGNKGVITARSGVSVVTSDRRPPLSGTWVQRTLPQIAWCLDAMWSMEGLYCTILEFAYRNPKRTRKTNFFRLPSSCEVLWNMELPEFSGKVRSRTRFFCFYDFQ